MAKKTAYTETASTISGTKTPQSQPILGRESEMALNAAGGFTFKVTPFTQLERFLILGTEGGTYYASEKKISLENTKNLIQCLKLDGPRTVRVIVEISYAGRAPKNDPAIFALAVATHPKYSDEITRQQAYNALPKICRTGTHLFQFMDICKHMDRGQGSGWMRGISNWYNKMSSDRLAYQMVKYRGRHDWRHFDALNVSHPNPEKGEGDISQRKALYKWAVNFSRYAKAEIYDVDELQLIPPIVGAYVMAQKMLPANTDASKMAEYIKTNRLTREMIPTEWLSNIVVQEALLADTPITAMIRNLANMTRSKLLTVSSDATKHVCTLLKDQERIRKGRVHPVQILLALRTYESGKGMRSKGESYTPVNRICDALESAFYLAFANVEPTGKTHMLAFDVSASMGGGSVAGLDNFLPVQAEACMGLVALKGGDPCHTMCFSDTFKPVSLRSQMTLADAESKLLHHNFGGTDCALPMVYAAREKIPVDVFVVYTDSETWAGGSHPVQALKAYRQKMGTPAKLVVMAFTSTGFTIADPEDAGMLDVVGFDANVPAVMRDFIVH